ncbi:hypothetical protein PanWU01x14_279410 [Parasponia andersonii]|uniref:Uncharacterized protein n=1 Tax=Parasponia andersonii TaxID=3476 RepID=A0A2P5B1U3_PARAD|nr:hypothetical protein PanWU01x14_279410 [Parasponia andersonii]
MKIAEVEQLRESGEFTSSLVISLPQSGDTSPTTKLSGGGTAFKRKIEEIWESLIDVEVTKIGVYGMGGSVNV